MNYLLIFLLFPIVWPIIAKIIWHNDITLSEMCANIGIIAVMVTILWFCAVGSQSHDIQLLNGQVTSKNRDHGTYEQAYSCNCVTTTDSKGNSSTICQTCYETHYTVKWYLDSTVGRISIDSEDSTSSRVYKTPDPDLYSAAYISEPCSTTGSFTNYVKGTPDSLFNKESLAIEATYAKFIPEYPQIYSIYKVMRVLNVGSLLSSTKINKFNSELNNRLRALSPKKQVNIIAIVTGIQDPSYRYAVESRWVGGKKNDVVVFLGMDKDEKITWADVMTYGLNRGNEMFRVMLRDDLLNKNFDPVTISDIIEKQVIAKFDRIPMTKFEYLKDRINPSDFMMWLIGFVSIIGTLGLSLYFYVNDPFNEYRRY